MFFPNKTVVQTAAQFVVDNTVLEPGQVGYEKDTHQFKIGNGITPWEDLPYLNGLFLNADFLMALIECPEYIPEIDWEAETPEYAVNYAADQLVQIVTLNDDVNVIQGDGWPRTSGIGTMPIQLLVNIEGEITVTWSIVDTWFTNNVAPTNQGLYLVTLQQIGGNIYGKVEIIVGGGNPI